MRRCLGFQCARTEQVHCYGNGVDEEYVLSDVGGQSEQRRDVVQIESEEKICERESRKVF